MRNLHSLRNNAIGGLQILRNDAIRCLQRLRNMQYEVCKPTGMQYEIYKAYFNTRSTPILGVPTYAIVVLKMNKQYQKVALMGLI